MKDNKKLGVINSHALLVEPIVLGIINSGQNKKITNLDEIGGVFQMEDYGILTIDNKGKAYFERGGEKYNVDLNKIEKMATS